MLSRNLALSSEVSEKVRRPSPTQAGRSKHVYPPSGVAARGGAMMAGARRQQLAFMKLRASSLTNSVSPSSPLRAALTWASSSAGWDESTPTTRNAPPAAAFSANPPL